MSGMVGTAPSTTTLTLPDGSTIALADWIDDKLYGSAQLTNGQTSPLEIFSTGRSQPIPGGIRVQTGVDTNIPRNGDTGLPKDWEMLVYGWGLMITRIMNAGPNGYPILADGIPQGSGTTESDVPLINTLFQIDRVTMFLYEYNAKIYTKGVLQDYPAGHGYTVFTTNTATEIAQNGVQSPRDRVALVLPVHERENLGYKGILQPEAPLFWVQNATLNDANTALNYADIKLYKYGLIKRTVV